MTKVSIPYPFCATRAIKWLGMDPATAFRPPVRKQEKQEMAERLNALSRS
jgi:hypothetical protein